MRVADVEQDEVWVTRRMRTDRVHLKQCHSVKGATSSRRVETSALTGDIRVCKFCSGEYNPREDLDGGDRAPLLALEQADPAQYP